MVVCKNYKSFFFFYIYANRNVNTFVLRMRVYMLKVGLLTVDHKII